MAPVGGRDMGLLINQLIYIYISKNVQKDKADLQICHFYFYYFSCIINIRILPLTANTNSEILDFYSSILLHKDGSCL